MNIVRLESYFQQIGFNLSLNFHQVIEHSYILVFVFVWLTLNLDAGGRDGLAKGVGSLACIDAGVRVPDTIDGQLNVTKVQ